VAKAEAERAATPTVTDASQVTAFIASLGVMSGRFILKTLPEGKDFVATEA